MVSTTAIAMLLFILAISAAIVFVLTTPQKVTSLIAIVAFMFFMAAFITLLLNTKEIQQSLNTPLGVFCYNLYKQ